MIHLQPFKMRLEYRTCPSSGVMGILSAYHEHGKGEHGNDTKDSRANFVLLPSRYIISYG